MRRIIAFALAFVLLCLCFTAAASAAEDKDGVVIYRQSFADVSDASSAGIRKGNKNADCFSLDVDDDCLKISTSSLEKAYVILPYYNTLEDYTVKVSFSFYDIIKENGYVALMLTSRGDEPDNIDSITVRADGRCDEWGSFSDELVNDLKNGNKAELTVYVESGIPRRLELSSAGNTEELSCKSLVDVVEGSIGFIVRNLSVSIHDVKVISGTRFTEITGELADSSTWTDEYPYIDASMRIRPMMISEPEVSASQTGDSGFIWSAVLVAVSVAAVVFIVKTGRKK